VAFNRGGIVKYNCFWKQWESTEHMKMGTEYSVTFTSKRPICKKNILSRRVS